MLAIYPTDIADMVLVGNSTTTQNAMLQVTGTTSASVFVGTSTATSTFAGGISAANLTAANVNATANITTNTLTTTGLGTLASLSVGCLTGPTPGSERPRQCFKLTLRLLCIRRPHRDRGYPRLQLHCKRCHLDNPRYPHAGRRW